MTKIILYNNTKWSLSKKSKAELDRCLEDVKTHEMDLLIVLDGKEGVGKSFSARGVAMYCATYLGTTFGVENIEFDIMQYVENSLKGGQFRVNVLDEGRKALGRAKRTKEVNFFLDYLSECRSKQQIHIILVPAFHDLSSYIVRWRMRMLFHFRKSYVNNPNPEGMKLMKRGEFKLFSSFTNLNYEYENRTYKYPKFYDDWNWWSNKEVFAPEAVVAYNDKKDKYTIKKYGSGVENSARALTNMRRNVVPSLIEHGISKKAIAKMFDVDFTQISRDINLHHAKQEYNITSNIPMRIKDEVQLNGTI